MNSQAPIVSAERRRLHDARVAQISRLRELLDMTLDYTPAGAKIDALKQLLKLARDLMPRDQEFVGIRRKIERELGEAG